MPATYQLIASNTLSSSAASVTFSAIPGTYTDLVLRWSARKDDTNSLLRVRLNSDATALYSETFVQGSGTAAISARGDNTNQWSPRVEISTDTANTFSSTELYIPNYTASQNKVGSRFDVTENNAAAAFIRISGQLYRSTTSITSLAIDATGGNIVSGSSFFLYGIKSS